MNEYRYSTAVVCKCTLCCLPLLKILNLTQSMHTDYRICDLGIWCMGSLKDAFEI